MTFLDYSYFALVFIYIIVLSIYTDRFHKILELKLKFSNQFRLKRITKDSLEQLHKREDQHIRKTIIQSIITIAIIMTVHLIVCRFSSEYSILKLLISLGIGWLFLLILIGVYILKGRSSGIQNRKVFSGYQY